ncbi:triose-phosphate isomerase [[Eubacterium] cellulosolvens]
MRTPAIVINFKGYQEVVGKKGLELAKICDVVAQETGCSIVIAPQIVDLALTVQTVNIPVFAQSIDNVKPGSCTGSVTPESVAAAGAEGTLINHSEHRLKMADIDALIQRTRNLGLKTILCTNNLPVTKASAALQPDFVAIEPPELIGGDISVTTADPEIVKNAVQEVKSVNPQVSVLCGAGVKTGVDVRKAIELGTEGVLLASGITKATDPKGALMELVKGLE